MRRLTVPLLTLALAGVVQVGGGTAAAATAPTAAGMGPAASTVVQALAPPKRRTPYAFNASGYGSKFDGGDVPVGAGKTAAAFIGCNNLSGVTRTNFVADVDVPDTPFSLSGVRTSLQTREKGTGAGVTYSSSARQRVADVNLVGTPLGRLSISGLTGTATTSVKGGRYRTDTDVQVAGIAVTSAGGDRVEFPVPAPNRPTIIPGVAEVSLGKAVEKRTRQRGLADASVLKVRTLFTPEPIRLTVANARASIDTGVKNGVFSGFSTGVEASAADGIVRVGRNPVRRMPCQGTGGKVQQSNLAEVDVSSRVQVKAARAQQKSMTSRTSASGYERGSVATVRVGGDALVVRGIVGQATVTRTGNKVVKRPGGGVGSVRVDGRVATFPRSGVLRVPGVAKLEEQVVQRYGTGLQVIGLRITLLDGTGATVDLGKAQLKIGLGAR